MVTNLTISELKKIVADLPDDMPVIIPVIDEDDCNQIFGFRFVRTAGLLSCEGEKYDTVLCLNAAADEQDIADQVRFSGKDVSVAKVLLGRKKSSDVTSYTMKRMLGLT